MNLDKTAIKAKKKIAIITGASSGLGREFALQIEKEYFLDEIWLVARRTEPMKELADHFTKAKGIVIQCDLNSKGDLLALENKLELENPELQFLVNNAGYGKIGPFAELGIEEQLQMIDLNVRALTQLSHIALRFMCPGSCLFQVASSIAFCPAPNFAIYAASKAFVLSFSKALNFEQRDKGIHIIAVCPGPVHTEFFSVAQRNNFTQKHIPPAEPINKAFAAEACDVVALALADARALRMVSVYGFPIKLFTTFIRFVPIRLAMKAIQRRL